MSDDSGNKLREQPIDPESAEPPSVKPLLP